MKILPSKEMIIPGLIISAVSFFIIGYATKKWFAPKAA